MDPRDYDPIDALPYLELLDKIARNFREIRSHEELRARLGVKGLTDVSEVPDFQSMKAAFPLPSGFDELIYQFRDPILGRGTVDAAFHDDELVNLRAQLFFKGWFAKSKARKYLYDALVPLFRGIFGPPNEEDPNACAFSSSGLLAVVRYVPGTPSVSVALTDEKFA